MSGGQACQCGEKREPIKTEAGSNRPGRMWRVWNYRCNYSAFNGYHRTPSDYSLIGCLACGAMWRTKAPYVDSLPQITEEERSKPRSPRES